MISWGSTSPGIEIGNGTDQGLPGEVRQLEDRLGLTPKAAHMLNYRLVQDRPTTSPVADLDEQRRKMFGGA